MLDVPNNFFIIFQLCDCFINYKLFKQNFINFQLSDCFINSKLFKQNFINSKLDTCPTGAANAGRGERRRGRNGVSEGQGRVYGVRGDILRVPQTFLPAPLGEGIGMSS